MPTFTILLYSPVQLFCIVKFLLLIAKLDLFIDCHNSVLPLQNIEDTETLKSIENQHP